MREPTTDPGPLQLLDAVLRTAGEPLEVGARAYLETHLGSVLCTPKTQPGSWSISRRDDLTEQEADRLAEAAMRSGRGAYRHDFRAVRVHRDEKAAASARALNARAYTVGRHVVFGPGAYAPNTGPGLRLLAHELAHVLQQQALEDRLIQRAEADTAENPAALAALADSFLDINNLVNEALDRARANARFPASGEWILSNPKLVQRPDPPFAVLTIDFVSKTGSVRYLKETTQLSNFSFVGPRRFRATYKMGSNSGTFEGEYDPHDQVLDLDFMGSVKTSCNGRPVETQGTYVVPQAVMEGVFLELGSAATVTRGTRFVTDGLSKSPIEDWVRSLGPTKIYEVKEANSKYRGVDYGIWMAPRFATRIIAPSMKINGISVGSDKIAHFFEEGYLYWQRAFAASNPVQGDRDAEEWGRGSEIGRYGLATTGVYSNADLEANRKGFQFFKDLAANPAMTFDIRTYINPNWNEEVNPNAYQPSVGKTVWRNLLSRAWKGQAAMGSQSIPVTVQFNFREETFEVEDSDFLVHIERMTGTLTYQPKSGPAIAATIKNLRPSNRLNSDGAITGVRIDYDWSVPNGGGSGYWESRGEGVLEGAWGNGNSNSNAGKMTLK